MIENMSAKAEDVAQQHHKQLATMSAKVEDVAQQQTELSDKIGELRSSRRPFGKFIYFYQRTKLTLQRSALENQQRSVG